MVNNKMCISVGGDELMCRIDPDLHDTVLEKGGCREMIHGGRVMRGFVFVQQDAIKNKRDFDYWIKISLEFNKKAKASKKLKKK